MSQHALAQAMDAPGARSSWKRVYQAGGVAALLMVVLIPVGAIPFVIAPRPDTVGGWFALLQTDRLLGLAFLDVPNLAVNIAGIMLYLALYAALRRSHESFTTVAATLGIVAIGLYVVSNPALAMLSLNDQYAAAATEAQRATLLGAGQAVLTMYQSSTAFDVSYAFGAVATLILSAVMLRSRVFGRGTAYAGIVASLITLGLFVPGIGLYISVFSLVPYAAWLILVASRLFRLGRSDAG